jgi:hypothetical protein
MVVLRHYAREAVAALSMWVTIRGTFIERALWLWRIGCAAIGFWCCCPGSGVTAPSPAGSARRIPTRCPR